MNLKIRLPNSEMFTKTSDTIFEYNKYKSVGFFCSNLPHTHGYYSNRVKTKYDINANPAHIVHFYYLVDISRHVTAKNAKRGERVWHAFNQGFPKFAYHRNAHTKMVS